MSAGFLSLSPLITLPILYSLSPSNVSLQIKVLIYCNHVKNVAQIAVFFPSLDGEGFLRVSGERCD